MSLSNPPKDAKEKYEKLNEANREPNDRLVKIKEDYIQIKVDHDNYLVANEFLSCETHEVATSSLTMGLIASCVDLSKVDQSSHHEDLVEKLEVMSLENEKLKKYLTDATTKEKLS